LKDDSSAAAADDDTPYPNRRSKKEGIYLIYACQEKSKWRVFLKIGQVGSGRKNGCTPYPRSKKIVRNGSD